MLDWTTCKADAFLRAEVSWRKMLLVQPPPKELNVFRDQQAIFGSMISQAKVSFADSASGGVTMGLVYDITESFLRGEQRSRFELSVINADTGPPQIMLRLVFAPQCMFSVQNIDFQWLVSQGANSLWEVSALQWNRVDEYSEGYGKLSEGWDTDLSAERNGIEPWAWEEWKRKRARISDLVSDVR